ncbi:MAG: tetratricopeptide repeat protein [Chloroflexi bacterium]|nr:tetratricopeptide repeat protein [Chloroflexota bacterium]
MTTDDRQRARFITFYSTRGGVGRTLAAYNVGCLIAASGRRVLLVDLDLDQPGLTFFTPTATEPSVGIVDILNWLMDRPTQLLDRGRPTSMRDMLNDDLGKEYGIVGLTVPYIQRLGLNGKIDLLPAGSRDPEIYIPRLERFQDRHDVFREYRDELAYHVRLLVQDQYDYVILDSRTGLTDLTFFSCLPMADNLVMLTGLSKQHLVGLANFVDKMRFVMEGNQGTIVVSSPVPEGDFEPVKQKTDHIRQLLDTLKNPPPLLSLAYHPTLLYDELLIVDTSERSSLARDYLELHASIRSICGDGVEEWTSRLTPALRGKNFSEVEKILRSRRGFDLLSGQAGESNYRELLRQTSDYLFRLTPDELKGADELIESFAREAPEDYQHVWIMARCLASKGEHPKAEAYWEKAVNMVTDSTTAETIKLERVVTEDRWGMGVLPGSVGNQDQKELERIYEVQLDHSDEWGMALTWHSLAELERGRGNYEKTRHYLIQALSVHQKLQDRAKEATARHALGLLDRLIGEYESAKNEMNRALEIKESLEDKHGVSVLRHSLAELARLQGREQECRVQCQQAFEGLQQKRGEGVIRFTLSLLEIACENLEAAIEAMSIEREIADQSGDDAGKLIATFYLEAIKCLQDIRLPLEHLDRHYTEVKLLPVVDQGVRADLLRAQILLARNMPEDASRAAQLVVRRASELGLQGLEADGHAIMAVSLESQGRRKESLSEATKASEFYKKHQVTAEGWIPAQQAISIIGTE